MLPSAGAQAKDRWLLRQVGERHHRLGDENRVAPEWFGHTDTDFQVASDSGQVPEQHLIFVVLMRPRRISSHPCVFLSPERLGYKILVMIPDDGAMKAGQPGDPDQQFRIPDWWLCRDEQSETNRWPSHWTRS